jgi:hypothetical protein
MHNVYSSLHRAGVISKELEEARNDALIMCRIPQDVVCILGVGQKVVIIRDRVAVCRTFLNHLENFWRSHYSKNPTVVSMDDELAASVNDTYGILSRANFDVSHDGKRNVHLLEKFLSRVDRGDTLTEDYMKWAMTAASGLPDTFISVYDLYTGRTKVDIRSFFPDIDFTI